VAEDTTLRPGGSPLAPGGPTLDQIDPSGAISEAADRAGRTTRGGLLKKGGAGAATFLTALRAPPTAAAAVQGLDRAILNYALVLEYLQASFYTEAERMHALKGALARQAQVVGAHERGHVRALRAVLGSAAIARPRFDYRGVTEDPSAFRDTAVAFEDLAVAAYKGQAPRVQSKELLGALLSIHSVEARHAAWIRYLAGRLPAPDAFDEPMPRRRVVAIVEDTRFIVAPAGTSGAPTGTSGTRTPRFTG
jgi:Ferritin-like domain